MMANQQVGFYPVHGPEAACSAPSFMVRHVEPGVKGNRRVAVRAQHTRDLICCSWNAAFTPTMVDVSFRINAMVIPLDQCVRPYPF